MRAARSRAPYWLWPLGWLLPLLALLIGSNCGGIERSIQRRALGQLDTHVYLVRHAEKDLTPGLPDPPLTAAGQVRAQALREALGSRSISGIFSTATARTRATAEPLATQRHLPIQPYDARQLPALASQIRRRYLGGSVLVVGHSNTILETIEALGARRPVPAVQDNEYDYLLEVRVPADSTQPATAVARRYGAASPR